MCSAISSRCCSSAGSPTRSARNAILPAIGIGIASTVVFAAASGTAWLFAARALSGFSTGLGAGAATAWIAELYTGRGNGTAARIAASANFFGCAAGPLFGGLFAQFAPWPLRLPYLVYLILLCAVAVAVLFVSETVGIAKAFWRSIAAAAAWRSAAHSAALLVASGVRLCHFSLIGFYSALIPNLLVASLHRSAPAVAGAVVCLVFGVAAVTILSTGRLEARPHAERAGFAGAGGVAFGRCGSRPIDAAVALRRARSAASPAGWVIAAASK